MPTVKLTEKVESLKSSEEVSVSVDGDIYASIFLGLRFCQVSSGDTFTGISAVRKSLGYNTPRLTRVGRKLKLADIADYFDVYADFERESSDGRVYIWTANLFEGDFCIGPDATPVYLQVPEGKSPE